MSTLVPINLVSKRTGLSQHVIRIWEKRYSAVVPARTQGGQRAYSDEDVLRLNLLRRLSEAGHKISGIARLPREELEGLWAREQPLPVTFGNESEPENELVQEMLRCIATMDRSGLEDLLRKAAVKLGAHASLEKVIAPLTEKVGELWREGTLNAAHEHFASVSIREFLWGAIRPYSANAKAPGILITTPTGQLHELGAIIVGAAAADLGWRVVYLGPSLPPAEIASAAAQNGVRAVGLSIVYPEDDSELPGELEVLRRYLPGEIAILAGGRAAAAYADVLDRIGARQPKTLTELYRELDELRKVRK
jgi:methylmalonyl-CoA mutase cobalamin-binding domain/chain